MKTLIAKPNMLIELNKPCTTMHGIKLRRN